MSKKVTNSRKKSQEKNECLQVLGCICCGTVHNLIPYDIDNFYDPIKHLNFYKPISRFNISSDLVPVCLRCSIEFQRWLYVYSYFKKVRFLSSIIFLLSIIGLITIISSHLLLTISIISIATYLIIFNFQLSKKIKSMDCNPHDFIHISKNQILLRHYGTKRWLKYEEWIKETIYYRLYLEEGTKIPAIHYQCSDFTNCCYCGAKVLKDDIKCVKCEKYLPLIS